MIETIIKTSKVVSQKIAASVNTIFKHRRVHTSVRQKLGSKEADAAGHIRRSPDVVKAAN